MKTWMKALACSAAVASAAGCVQLGPHAAPVRSGDPAQAQAREIDVMIRGAMRENRIVGMSAVVISGGRRLLSAGYGLADRARKVPVTTETVFPLGSITKLFTATAVMQLVERGRLDLDAPVSRYLPETEGYASSRGASAGTPVSTPTLRQLLTHHGGLPGNIMEGFELKRPDPALFRRLPRLFAQEPAPFTPDTVFAYSNAGYGLLGCVVERASGASYVDFVTRGILEPLGMGQTRFFSSAADSEGVAMGYDGNAEVPVYPIRDMPAGALMASAADMERFMSFVLDQGRDGVLGSAAFAEMVTRQNGGVALDGEFSIGLGYWLLRPFPVPETFASHGGDLPPFHTLLVTIPERRIGVFLAANSSGAASALIPLAIRILRAVYSAQTGTPVEDAPVPPKTRLEPAVLDGLAGSYASPMGLIVVRSRRGKLLADAFGLPLLLAPRGDGSFTAELSMLGAFSVPIAPLEPLRFAFVQRAGGRYLRMTASGFFGGAAERFTPAEVPAAWRARAGSYTILEREENVIHRWPRTVALRYESSSGTLLLCYEFVGTKLSFPLAPSGDHEAVIVGTGAGLGERIVAYEEGGRTRLEWSGLLLEKK